MGEERKLHQQQEQKALPSVIPFFDEEENRQKRMRQDKSNKRSLDEKHCIKIAKVGLEVYNKSKGSDYKLETPVTSNIFFDREVRQVLMHANFWAKKAGDDETELFFAEAKGLNDGFGIEDVDCCIIEAEGAKMNDDIRGCIHCHGVRHPAGIYSCGGKYKAK